MIAAGADRDQAAAARAGGSGRYGVEVYSSHVVAQLAAAIAAPSHHTPGV